MNFLKRVYHDFVLPSQVDKYEMILKKAAEKNYQFHTVLSFQNLIKSQEVDVNKKYMIIRRDVDTCHYRCLKKMLVLERKYNARCSYYFRWNTLDIKLANVIELEYKGEASYHYEEVALYAYKNHIKNPSELTINLTFIQQMFLNNYFLFKKQTGLPCRTIASHGDFINRKLKCSNTILIDDKVREIINIECETYDAEQNQYITCRIADQGNDQFVQQALGAIDDSEPVIYLLTHPAQWEASFWANIKADMDRIWRNINY